LKEGLSKKKEGSIWREREILPAEGEEDTVEARSSLPEPGHEKKGGKKVLLQRGSVNLIVPQRKTFKSRLRRGAWSS